MPTNREYVLCAHWNQCRGSDSAVLLTVEDQHGIVWDDVQVSRDGYDSVREYRDAIETRKNELRKAWRITNKTRGNGGY